MLKAGDKGDAVKKLQNALMALGFPLPRWGADGDLGAETFGAVDRLFVSLAHPFDEDAAAISDADLEVVYAALASKQKASNVGPVDSSLFYDLRGDADRSHIIQRRAWSQVTGICLHQTACVMGERPLRWATCGAHLGITRAGKVIWLHDFDYSVVHGHGFNSSTVGIEMDGMYAGVHGNDRTFWRPATEPNRQPQLPTAELVDSATRTIQWIRDEVARHGGNVTHLVAHRQASSSRDSDPGSALWKQVAVPYLRKGMTDGGDGYCIGTGSAIPSAWDDQRTGRY